MTPQCNCRKIFVLALLCATVSAGAALAQTTVEATAIWAESTYGAPAVRYIVQHQVNDGAWETVGTTTGTTYALDLTYDDVHRVRVAGIDAQDRQGPYSNPSEAFSPSGSGEAPGMPGQPYRIIID